LDCHSADILADPGEKYDNEHLQTTQVGEYVHNAGFIFLIIENILLLFKSGNKELFLVFRFESFAIVSRCFFKFP
jgi:hypothetical protein